MECQVLEFLVCWVNQLASRNLIILKPLLTEGFEEWKNNFFLFHFMNFLETLTVHMQIISKLVPPCYFYHTQDDYDEIHCNFGPISACVLL